MDDIKALTVTKGPHPLDGVLKLTISGLDALDVVSDDGAVNISGSGLIGQFTNATVDENDGQVTIYKAHHIYSRKSSSGSSKSSLI